MKNFAKKTQTKKFEWFDYVAFFPMLYAWGPQLRSPRTAGDCFMPTIKIQWSLDRLRPSKSGFTLVELMVVITVVCVIAGLGILQSSSFAHITARSELYKLHAVCRYLQSLARTTGHTQQLVFTCNGYQFDGQETTFASGVSIGCKPGIYGPPGKPTHAVNGPCSFAHNRIDFHPHGIISSGVVYIKGCDGRQYALSNSVSDISYLRNYEYADGWRQI